MHLLPHIRIQLQHTIRHTAATAHLLRIIRLAQYPILVQIKPIAHTEPVRTLLARKALQVVHIPFSPHHHLERRYQFIASRTHARIPVQSHVVTAAQQHVLTCVQRGARIAQPASAALARQARLVPEHVQSAKEEAVTDEQRAFGTEVRFFVGEFGALDATGRRVGRGHHV